MTFSIFYLILYLFSLLNTLNLLCMGSEKKILIAAQNADALTMCQDPESLKSFAFKAYTRSSTDILPIDDICLSIIEPDKTGRTPFFYATSEQEIKKLLILLDIVFAIKISEQAKSETIIHDTLTETDKTQALTLENFQVNVLSKCDAFGDTCLTYLIRTGQFAAAFALLSELKPTSIEQIEHLNKQTPDYKSLLFCAANTGALDIIALLKDKKINYADLELPYYLRTIKLRLKKIVPQSYRTSLYTPSSELLFSQGTEKQCSLEQDEWDITPPMTPPMEEAHAASSTDLDVFGRTPLFYATTKEQVHFLLENNSALLHQDDLGNTAFEYLVRTNHLRSALTVLAHCKPDLEYADEHFIRMGLCAIKARNATFLKRVLASQTISAQYLYRLLSAALNYFPHSTAGIETILNYCKEHGLNHPLQVLHTDLFCNYHEGYLIHQVAKKAPSLGQLFIEFGADPNIQDQHNRTPLMLAIEHHESVYPYFITSEVINLKNKWESALDCAKRKNRLAWQEALLNYSNPSNT